MAKKKAAEAKQGKSLETSPEPVPPGTAVFVDWPPGPPKLGVLVKYNKGKLGPCPVVRIARVDAKGKYTGEMGAPRVFELKDLVGPAVPLRALEIGTTESAAEYDARVGAMSETGIARALYRRQALLRGEKLLDYEVDGVDASGRRVVEGAADDSAAGDSAALEPNYPDPNVLVDKLLEEDAKRGSKVSAKKLKQRQAERADALPPAGPSSGELIDVRIGRTQVWERCKVINVAGNQVGFTSLDDDTRGLRELTDEGKTWKRLGDAELAAHAAMSTPPPELVKPVPPQFVAAVRQKPAAEVDPRGTPKVGDPLIIARNSGVDGRLEIPVTVHKVNGDKIGVTYSDGALDVVIAAPSDVNWRRPTEAELRRWPKVGTRASRPAESPPDAEAMASGAEKERREVERQGEKALRKASGAKKQTPVQKAAASAGVTMEGNVIVERGVQRSERIMMYNDSQPGDPVKLVALGEPQPLPPAVDEVDEKTLGAPDGSWAGVEPNHMCEHCGEAVRGSEFHRCDQMMGFDKSPPFEVDDTPPWEA